MAFESLRGPILLFNICLSQNFSNHPLGLKLSKWLEDLYIVIKLELDRFYQIARVFERVHAGMGEVNLFINYNIAYNYQEKKYCPLKYKFCVVKSFAFEPSFFCK